MMTVKEVSKLTGVSVRTLHYYDGIGLLPPAVTTDAGYRMYDDTSLERLQNRFRRSSDNSITMSAGDSMRRVSNNAGEISIA